MSNATTNFGREMSCTTSIRTGRFVSQIQLVAESVYRRLTTPRGMLRGSEEEENFGFDIASRVGASATPSDSAALPGQIRGELLKDERIQSVDVNVLTTTSGGQVSYDVTVKAVTNDGPFTLQLRVSSVTTELLGIKVDA